MNANHAREMSRFLRHHSGLNASSAQSPTMRDVSHSGMLIHAPRDGDGGRDHSVPFSPPLASWDEIRPRLGAMGEASREALGLSDLYITEYIPPRGFDCVVFGSVLFYFCCALSLPWIKPGTQLWEMIGKVFPGGTVWFRWLVKTIVVPVLGIHVTEIVLLDRWKMQRHGVPRWSRIWWQWELTCFMDGICTWWRIAALLERKKEEKESKKH
jgi:hypothetical protein